MDEELWESELMDVFYEQVTADVEYLDSNPTGKHITLILEVGSVDSEELMEVVMSLAKFLQLNAENDVLTYEPDFR